MTAGEEMEAAHRRDGERERQIRAVRDALAPLRSADAPSWPPDVRGAAGDLDRLLVRERDRIVARWN